MTELFELLVVSLGWEACVCLVTAILSAAVACLATPLVRMLAIRIGCFDDPGGRRIHRRRTARLGGVAVLVAIVVSVWQGSQLLRIDELAYPERLHNLPIILGIAGFVCGLGVIDDRWELRPSLKMLGLVAAGLALPFAGVCVDHVEIPAIGVVELGWFAIPVTLFWVLACTNAINLIDGVDGAATGVTWVSSGTLALVALATCDVVTAILFAGLCGSAAGFLVHNRQPASIFLGDSGSLTIGFLIAAASAQGGAKEATAVSLFLATLVLAVPFLDTAQSFARRFLKTWRQGGAARLRRAVRAVAIGDTGHIHHRLLQLGFSHRQTSRALTLVTAVAGMTAFLMLPGEMGSIAATFAMLTVAWLLWRLATMPETLKHPVPSAEKNIVIPAVRPRRRAATSATTTAPELVGASSRATSGSAAQT